MKKVFLFIYALFCVGVAFSQDKGNVLIKRPETTTPAARRALSVRQAADLGSAVIGPTGNARNVRTIEADIGQFAIAELGQFADVSLIVPERLDHADEREKHGSLLVVTIQPLKQPHR